MKNLQKKDELLNKFQNSKIERIKLGKISGGNGPQKPVTLATTPTDVQTGLTSNGNHDNINTAAD